MRTLWILLQDTIRLTEILGGKNTADLPIYTLIMRPKHPNNCLSRSGGFSAWNKYIISKLFFFHCCFAGCFVLPDKLSQFKKPSWIFLFFFFFNIQVRNTDINTTWLPWVPGFSMHATPPLPPQPESSGGIKHIQCKTHLEFKNPDSTIP